MRTDNGQAASLDFLPERQRAVVVALLANPELEFLPVRALAARVGVGRTTANQAKTWWLANKTALLHVDDAVEATNGNGHMHTEGA